MNKNRFTNNIFSNPVSLISLIAILGISSCAVAPGETENEINVSSKNSSTVASNATNKSNEVMVFAGSGTNLSLIKILAAEFQKTHPDFKIEVPTSIGTTGAINAVVNEKITVGLGSRPLKESEKNIGLQVIPYAKTAVIIGANPTVKDDNITFQDLIDIYKGTKTRWSDGQEIIVLTREPGDSSTQVIKQNIPGFKEVYKDSQEAKRWKTLFTDQEADKALQKTDFAIGISDRGLMFTEKVKIKALNLNGIAPTTENVITGKYPLTKTLTFILPQEEISSDVQAFIDFVLSSEGQKIIEANGYFPLK